MHNQIIFAENLQVLRMMPSGSANLMYIDPPFNTGKIQTRTQVSTVASANGDRTGFQGRRYQTTSIGSKAFSDAFDDYLGFLQPRLVEAHRILAQNGTLYVHLDYREVHYVKVLLDSIFGRDCFLNEIIWAYDFGGRPKNKWPPKHDTILVFVKNPADYVFNYDDVDRIPYLAPGLVGPEKAARGKMPTDTWWHTIVPTNGKEKTGYPTQKPLGILKRIILASSNPGDRVLDFFAGSGTTGEACQQMGRRFVLIDENPEALQVMAKRFEHLADIEWVGFDPKPFQSTAAHRLRPMLSPRGETDGVNTKAVRPAKRTAPTQN
jgi:site-specific DNA-methyltransferase (adenine-specific)